MKHLARNRPRKLTRGQENIDWIEQWCRIPEGRHIGRPVTLRPWQKRIIKGIYDQPTRRAIITFGRKNGKALCINTLLPTPGGFVKIGDIRTGDQVFDDRGQPCTVTYVSPVRLGRPCWRLTFADGSQIVADEDHQWLTTHSYRPWANARVNGSGNGGRWRAEVVDTQQISESVYRLRKDGGKEHNHKIAVAGAVQTAERDLLLPPYVLGYWLGNGDTARAVVTCGSHDAEVISALMNDELGMECRHAGLSGGRAPRYALTDAATGSRGLVQAHLRALGVIGNKHIPEPYLWASQAQRLALLQGLLDSDGTVGKNGGGPPRVYYDSTVEQLARNVLQLARSLGFKATIKEGVAKLDGRDMGAVWTVSFTAYDDQQIFRLQRKQDLLAPRPSRLTRAATNAIVACEPVPSVPTVCIQVDSPSSLFLAGEGFTPTHNTSLAAFLLLLHLCGPEARANSQLYSAAQSRDQAAILFQLAAKIVRMTELQNYVGVRDTAKQLYCQEMGTLYRALSADASTAYGLSPVFIVHDELGQVKGPRSELYEALETATAAQENPLSVVVSTQAPTDADLLSILIDDAKAEKDPRVRLFLWSADPEEDPFSEATIKQANPAFGDFQSSEEVLAMAEDARRMPSREAEYRNLVLNQRVETASPLITPSVWKSCAFPVIPSFDSKPVYAGLDLSETSDLTALVLIAPHEGKWHVKPTFWLPSEGLFERSRKDRVPYDQWHRDGLLETTPGKTVEYEFVADYMRVLFDRYDMRRVAFDRYNWKHLRPWLEKAGFSEPELERFVEFGQGYVSMSPAIRDLESSFLSAKLAHGDHPVLRMCAANAVVTLDPAGNRKLDKRKARGRIDGMIALTMALAVAMTEELLPEPDYQVLILGTGA